MERQWTRADGSTLLKEVLMRADREAAVSRARIKDLGVNERIEADVTTDAQIWKRAGD
jgi:hypothetical protein